MCTYLRSSAPLIKVLIHLGTFGKVQNCISTLCEGTKPHQYLSLRYQAVQLHFVKVPNGISTFWKGADAVFFQAEDGIRDTSVTGVQTCALPILQVLRRWPPGAPACPRTRCRTGVVGPCPAPPFPTRRRLGHTRVAARNRPSIAARHPPARRPPEIGRASCRERV